VIDKLLDFYLDADGEEWFLVKWYGYSQPTWQLRARIPQELTSRYFAKKRRSAVRKSKRR